LLPPVEECHPNGLRFLGRGPYVPQCFCIRSYRLDQRCLAEQLKGAPSYRRIAVRAVLQ
jgi:hypothetical protein